MVGHNLYNIIVTQVKQLTKTGEENSWKGYGIKSTWNYSKYRNCFSVNLTGE